MSLEVVAAIIFFENKILVTQRKYHKNAAYSYKFEFPGGKVENNEDKIKIYLDINSNTILLDNKYVKQVGDQKILYIIINKDLYPQTSINDIILDPFFGTGTTGAVAKKLNRNFIGIEQDINYVKSAQYRINNTKKIEHVELIQMPQKEKVKRIPFGSLIEKGLIIPGEILTDLRKRWTAKVRADGSLISRDNKGSIHSVGAALQGLPACNGWTFWHINRSGRLIPIDHLRNTIKLTA